MTATVCAVIPHHRGQEMLGRCLRRYLASRGVEPKVVLVVNGCREPLPREAADERVHVVRREAALGFSEANNLGAREAHRRWGDVDALLFLNNDAFVEPDATVRAFEALQREGVAIVGPRLMLWGAAGHLNSLGLRVTRNGEAWDDGIGRPLEEADVPAAPRAVLAVTGAAFLIRPGTLEALGGWPGYYGYYYEDIDLCLRARSRGLEVVVAPDAVVHHAISATTDRGSEAKVYLAWRNRWVLLLSRWPLRPLLRALPGLVWGELRAFVRRVRAGARVEARRQLKSWLGVVRRIPAALAARRHSGTEERWWAELEEPGTVPVIELPPMSDEPLREGGE